MASPLSLFSARIIKLSFHIPMVSATVGKLVKEGDKKKWHVEIDLRENINRILPPDYPDVSDVDDNLRDLLGTDIFEDQPMLFREALVSSVGEENGEKKEEEGRKELFGWTRSGRALDHDNAQECGIFGAFYVCMPLLLLLDRQWQELEEQDEIERIGESEEYKKWRVSLDGSSSSYGQFDAIVYVKKNDERNFPHLILFKGPDNYGALSQVFIKIEGCEEEQVPP